MDLVLDAVDDYVLDDVVGGLDNPPAWLERGHLVRQAVVLWAVYTVGALLLYLFTAIFSYYFVYGKLQNLGHRPFKGQMRAEIMMTLKALPQMSVLQVPVTMLEIRGYSKLYGPKEEYGWDDYGTAYALGTLLWFLVFTDFVIYWVHRFLHHPLLYKRLHKPHHLWKNPTPFASHAFHPVDGWSQGMAYHIYVFLFPMHKVVHLLSFIFVNFWTNSIHDGVSAFPHKILNGTAHHTYHHTAFNYNYGQYFVAWDWLFGTYLDPTEPGRLLHPVSQELIKKAAADGSDEAWAEAHRAIEANRRKYVAAAEQAGKASSKSSGTANKVKAG